ncbi:MAG: acetyl-CoA carboxylase biotin carboxyl carrier protein subunit [bacterium]
MRLFAKTSRKEYQVELNGSADNLSVSLDGKKKQVDLKRVGDGNVFSLIVDNHSYQLFIEPKSGGYEVNLNGEKYFVELEDERTRLLRKLIKSDEKPKGQIEIKAPMPGLIVKIEVEEGEKIKRGDGLIIIEAMKMENEIRANTDGIVKKVLKKENQSVDKDAALIILE